MTPVAPSLVLFDLDGVLVAYDRDARVRHLAAALGRTADAVRVALFDSGLEDRFDAGTVEGPDYLAELGDALGTCVDVDTWLAARGAAMRPKPATADLLERLATRCTLGLLTNNGGLLVDGLPGLFPALVAPFQGRLLCSGRLGLRKPDPGVFLQATRWLGHPPSRTLFLDDVEANVAGARKAGLQAARVDGTASLAAVLSGFGLG